MSLSQPICYIIGAAPALLPEIRKQDGDLIIAADAGYAACQSAGITPDLIVGDFDSLGTAPEGNNVIRLQVEKDDTDTAHAAELAYEKGYRHFVIFGALGGRRMDHSFANFSLAASLAARGGRCWLIGDGTVVTAIHGGTLSFPAGLSGDVSVFPFGGEAFGVTEEGLKYSLWDARLAGDCALGVSNSFTGEAGQISVRKGTLLIFYSGEFPKNLY